MSISPPSTLTQAMIFSPLGHCNGLPTGPHVCLLAYIIILQVAARESFYKHKSDCVTSFLKIFNDLPLFGESMATFLNMASTSLQSLAGPYFFIPNKRRQPHQPSLH